MPRKLINNFDAIKVAAGPEARPGGAARRRGPACGRRGRRPPAPRPDRRPTLLCNPRGAVQSLVPAFRLYRAAPARDAGGLWAYALQGRTGRPPAPRLY